VTRTTLRNRRIKGFLSGVSPLSGATIILRPVMINNAPKSQTTPWYCSNTAPRAIKSARQLRQVTDAPAAELGPVAQVEILAQRIISPSPGIMDGCRAPHPGCPVEVQEQVPPTASWLLDAEMAIDPEGLGHGKERIVAVQMAPPGLYHGYLRIVEVGDGLPQEVRGRDEVGVKDRRTRRELP
jgi:hypothetical protein